MKALNGDNAGWYLARQGGWVRVMEFARVFTNKGHAKNSLRWFRWHGPAVKPTRFEIIPVALKLVESGSAESYTTE